MYRPAKSLQKSSAASGFSCQTPNPMCDPAFAPLDIVTVELVPGCGMIVHFSDQTAAYFASEELAFLRPYRSTDHKVSH